MTKDPAGTPHSQAKMEQTRSDRSPFDTTLGSDPSLYLLHSAWLALLANDDDNSSSAYPSSSSLPLTSARQANAFLTHLTRQAKTTADSTRDDFEGRFRSSLWPIAAASSSSSTERSDLNDAINLLPSHWAAHNAFCPHCEALAIPAITTTTLLPRPSSRQIGSSKKRKRGAVDKLDKSRTGREREASKGPMQCLICCSPYKGANSTRTLSSEEREAQQIAKAKFPMTRSKGRQDGKKQGLASESTSDRKRATVQEQASSSSVDEKISQDPRPVSKIDDTAGPSRSQTIPFASQSSESNAVALLRKKEKQKVQEERPRTVQEDSSPPPKVPTSKIAEPIVPLARPKPSTSSHDDSRSKKMPLNSKTKKGEGASDHKSALKAMLMKDKKRKQQQEAAESTTKSGGGGGGLRDFLAGL